jgi:hypothetical protein
MTGPMRVEQPVRWYQVTACGNERCAIYLEHRNRERFSDLLGEAVARFRLALHAYVLMYKHVLTWPYQ